MYRKPEPSRNHPNSCHPPNAQAAGELCVDKTQSAQICNLCVEKNPRPRRARTNSGRAQLLIGKTIIGRFSKKESARARICSGATRAGVFFYTEIADLCRLGFIYAEFAGRLRVRRMVASGGWLRPGNFLGKNLGGRESARVFATQRSRIRGDRILSTQRLPMHWSLRGYNFFSALRADEKGVCICVYNRN